VIVAGVDLGVRKAAITIMDGDTITCSMAFESNARTRSLQLSQVAQWVREVCNGHRVDVVYVEEPLVGRSTRISLQIAQTAGAVLAYVSHLSDSYLVPTTTWKKEVVGHGGANKEKISEWLDSHYHDYSVQCDGDQDRVDATCIALYGRQQQLLAARLREDNFVSGA
jgi:Holliday junction resolvasome RuvABC endonuclease subunit